MSKPEDKIKTSTRRHRDDAAVNRQVNIAKSHGMPVKEPHKLAKHHAMNCGDPKCIMCSNPRRTFKELTQQERRLFQDLDTPNDKHSNGLPPREEV